MAVTVTGKNYTQISSCDSTSAGGTWSGVDTADTADKKEGSASLCGTLKSSGNNDTTFTPSSSVDLSGTKHVRFWFLITSGSLVNTYTSGGIQFWASDGTNTGYWYVGGRDTYPGGWHNFVVDVSRAVDSGTKPTSMNAITSMGTRHNLTASGKNVDNVWVDNLCVCDGLIAYGDDSGGYFDFEDIFDVDDDPTNGGWGIITKKAGTLCLVGSLEIGDSAGTNGTKFQAKSQVVIFEDRPDDSGSGSNINSGLMNINVVDNGTGTTEFILGSKSGTSGIEGCVVRTQNPSQVAKFDLLGNNSNVDNFKIYGSTVSGTSTGADSITLPAASASAEVLTSTFESCGEITASTCKVRDSNIVSAPGNGILLTSSHDTEDCNFISCVNATHLATVGPYDFDGHQFLSNTYDVNNTYGSEIVVNKLSESNPSSYTGSLVTFSASYSFDVIGLEQNTEVTIVTAGTSTVLHHTENATTSDGGGKYKISYTHGGGASVDVFVHHTDYKPDISNIYALTLPSSNSQAKVKMFSDENYVNP